MLFDKEKYGIYLSSYASDLMCTDIPSIRTAVMSDSLSEFEVHFSVNKTQRIANTYNVIMAIYQYNNNIISSVHSQ